MLYFFGSILLALFLILLLPSETIVAPILATISVLAGAVLSQRAEKLSSLKLSQNCDEDE